MDEKSAYRKLNRFTLCFCGIFAITYFLELKVLELARPVREFQKFRSSNQKSSSIKNSFSFLAEQVNLVE